MLKFTERPKTPGMTSKKTLLSLKEISCYHTCQPSRIAWDTCAFWSMSRGTARIKEMSRIFKDPLKFSHIFPHFQFLDDFISRVFINIVFCRYSASNEVFDLRAFLFQIRSSFLKMVDSKKRKHVTAYNSSWKKDFSNRSCFAKQTCLLLSPMSKSYFLWTHG